MRGPRFGMKARDEQLQKHNAGVLRFAQDDGERQATAMASAKARANSNANTVVLRRA